MKAKLVPTILLITILFSTACHMRKAAGTKQEVEQNIPVPASAARSSDSTTHTPTPQFTPNTIVAPNTRPKPVPDVKAPVPPL